MSSSMREIAGWSVNRRVDLLPGNVLARHLEQQLGRLVGEDHAATRVDQQHRGRQQVERGELAHAWHRGRTSSRAGSRRGAIAATGAGTPVRASSAARLFSLRPMSSRRRCTRSGAQAGRAFLAAQTCQLLLFRPQFFLEDAAAIGIAQFWVSASTRGKLAGLACVRGASAALRGGLRGAARSSPAAGEAVAGVGLLRAQQLAAPRVVGEGRMSRGVDRSDTGRICAAATPAAPPRRAGEPNEDDLSIQARVDRPRTKTARVYVTDGNRPLHIRPNPPGRARSALPVAPAKRGRYARPLAARMQRRSTHRL